MQITGTIRIREAAVEAALLERLDCEIARVQALSDDAIEAMSTLIDARDPIDLVRKLYRYVVALASPGTMLERAFERDPDALPGFCLDLAAYRAYMDRLARGVSPRAAATEVERGRRLWLIRVLREHGTPPRASGRSSPADEDIDVYDAEGEIDPGAVRAEIDRLLRRLRVAPERVEVTILPDEYPEEGEPQ